MKAALEFFVNKCEKMSTAQIIALGFAGVIFVGGFLLWLPVSAAPGNQTKFIDAIFTATTCVCVTGLVTVTTATHWSLFGKLVIMLLIQLGGLGVISMGIGALLIAGRKIGTKGRRMIQEAYNLDKLGGTVRLFKRIIFSFLAAEGIGAILYCFFFVPRYGLIKGIGQSVFTSVSAFCNAGIDIMGEDSLMPYRGNILLNLITMGLIITAGLGFSVWWDLGDQIRKAAGGTLPWKRVWKNLRLQSKIVLSVTGSLLLISTLLIFIFEYHNPATVGNEPLGTKVIASAFQAVTTRTAGFLTMDQGKLSHETTLVSLVLMIIGGSPMGTAGGIKTTTFLVLAMSVLASLRGRRDVEVFNRKVKDSYLRSAQVVMSAAITVILVMTLLLCAVEDVSLVDALYEITSAVGTVGLTRGITPSLHMAGKLVVMVCMYLGRIGPLTLGMAVMLKGMVQPERKHLAEQDIMIG